MTQRYPDLHEHLEALKRAGLLVTVERPINKDTEMHPLVRWQFRGGIEEPERKAFLFTNVVDSKGKKYDIPVVVGALAASREIYRLGMGCPLDQINQTWSRAIEGFEMLVEIGIAARELAALGLRLGFRRHGASLSAHAVYQPAGASRVTPSRSASA